MTQTLAFADGGSGLRSGQKAAMPEVPCHGDVFHIQHQFEQVANGLIRYVQGGPARLLNQASQTRTWIIYPKNRSNCHLLTPAFRGFKLFYTS
ncbi:MAG: hypothetical protein WA949_14140 [Phormidesmis sp.]